MVALLIPMMLPEVASAVALPLTVLAMTVLLTLAMPVIAPKPSIVIPFVPPSIPIAFTVLDAFASPFVFNDLTMTSPNASPTT